MRRYALDVKLENTVKAFLGGFTSKVKEPSKEYALIHMQSVDPLTAVNVGTYNILHDEITIRSDIRSACALQGVKAQYILDNLMRMRLVSDDDGKQYPAVTVDKHGKSIYSPAVTSLEAVYLAVRFTIKNSIVMRNEALNLSKLTKQQKV